MSLQVRIAVFSQHHVDGLDLSSNPLLYMMRCYPVSSNVTKYIFLFFLETIFFSFVCACKPCHIAMLKVPAGSWTLVVVGSDCIMNAHMIICILTIQSYAFYGII